MHTAKLHTPQLQLLQGNIALAVGTLMIMFMCMWPFSVMYYAETVTINQLLPLPVPHPFLLVTCKFVFYMKIYQLHHGVSFYPSLLLFLHVSLFLHGEREAMKDRRKHHCAIDKFSYKQQIFDRMFIMRKE